MRKEFFVNKLPVILLIIFLVFGILINALFLFNRNVITHGLKVGGLDLGGLKKEKAIEELRKYTNHWSSSRVELILEEKRVKTSWPALGFEFEPETTIKKAEAFGKRGGFFNNIKRQLIALFGKENLNIEVSWNNTTLNNFTKIHFSQLIEESRNASLEFKNNQIILLSSKSGIAPDWQSFKKEVNQQAIQLIKPLDEYEISLTNVLPEIKDDETKEAREKARQILESSPYILEFEDKSWQIEKENIGNWLKFDPVFEKNLDNQILGLTLDKDLITTYLLSIIRDINRPSEKARLGFEDDQIKIQEPDKPGIELLLEESAELIAEDIFEGKNQLVLAVKKTEAEVSEKSLSELGIDALIGIGESNYTGSSLSRVNNIKVGSSKFDQHLIKPEEEFSFNETLGEISGKEGYLPGLVIKDNQLVPEYGGGICQVSTTMFRAAINSGLEVTERYPHSFPVSYYNPQGFDATVYPPHPDLRFINNTEGYILIQRRIEGNKLFFEMYGKDEGREVKVKGPYVYERDTEKGTFKTVLWQEVYNKDGEQISKKGFWSFYDNPSHYPVAEEKEEEESEEEETN